MTVKNTSKNDNKFKLISAICMLVIASIMVVTSTYAWVVLSTAPEVTEITTTVGANGALEIRLNIEEDATDNNSIFRNIVEFTNSKYGLDKITLLPSMPSDNFENNYLLIPEYNYDGLATEDGIAGKTVVGTLGTGDNFYQSDITGVRAVGTASDMTERQVAYSAAIKASKDAKKSALNNAKSSLNNNQFTSIVIKMLRSDNPEYDENDIAALGTIIRGLEDAVYKMEEAYKQTILAFAASSNGQSDSVYSIVKTLLEDGGLTLEAIAENGGVSIEGHTFAIDGTVVNGITAFVATKNTVSNVRNSYDRLGDEYDPSDVNAIFGQLVNRNGILVNGEDPSNINLDEVISNGATVTMKDGAGVYVEVADQVGDFSVNYSILDSTITLKTETSLSNPYLTSFLEKVEENGVPGGDLSNKPMTAFYGYIIDLGFKTNAKNSNLLLQTEGIDRIDNTNPSDATLGGGSYMEFSRVEGADISNDKVIEIMKCFRIVFFDTYTKAIFGTAKLDTANATVDPNNKVTAKIYMDNDDQVITALAQNTECNVSVLVYLDAQYLKNEHVSATTAQSITGVMNLQFASDADLIPMPYSAN